MVTFLLREQLGLGYVSTMVVSPDGRTVYFGRYQSYDHDRMNLGVLSLDSNGQPIGNIRYFRDCIDPLQPSKYNGNSGRSSVIKIALDSNRKKLYLTVVANGFQSLASSIERSHISVYDLDSDGFPKESSLVSFLSPISDGENINSLYSFAINKNKSKIYLAGNDAAVWVWGLDPNTGRPVDPNTGQPVNPDTGLPATRCPSQAQGNIGSYAKYDIAVNPDLNVLYLGSYGSGNETPGEPVGPLLEIIKLNSSNGDPITSGTDWYKSWNFGPTDPAVWPLPPAGRDSIENSGIFLQFHYTSKAIYRRRTSMREYAGQPAEVWPIIVWPLDQNTGIPISTLTMPNRSGGSFDDPYLGFAESIDSQTNRIWITNWNTFHDVFNPDPNSLPCISGVTVNQYNLDQHTYLPTGLPIQTSGPIDMRYGMLLANVPSQMPALLTQLKDELGYLSNLKFIGNEVRDWYLVVTVLEATPSSLIPVQGFSVKIDQYRPPKGIASTLPLPLQNTPIPLGTPSQPYCLNIHLKADDSIYLPPPYAFALYMFDKGSTVYFDSLKVQIEIYNKFPGPGVTPIWRQTEIVRGNRIIFVLPSYNFLADDPQLGRKAQIQFYSHYVKKCLDWSSAVKVNLNDRPKQFIISTFVMIGFQGSLSQLQTEIDTLVNLGINTTATAPDPDAYALVTPDWVWPGLDISQVQTALDNTGLKWRSAAVAVPVFFDFLPLDTTRLNNWATFLKACYGGSLANFVNLQLYDEPGWYYGSEIKTAGWTDMLEVVNNDPTYLHNFQVYLSSLPQEFHPSDFVAGPPPASSWSDPRIKATGGSAINASLETRRLFFWTMRFIVKSASNGTAIAKNAIIHAFDTEDLAHSPHHTNIFADWNNQQGLWYYAHVPPTNASDGPDVASARMDWFESGRSNAHTLWIDPWDLDQQAQRSSFLGDGLRSTGMLAPNYGNSPPQPGEPGGFGAYIPPGLAGSTLLGGHPAGATYKILALIGHGAKSIDFYNYGPYPFSVDEGLTAPQMVYLAQFQKAYKSIADATRLVGRAERLLFPGRPRRGNVAIYLPGISNLWDTFTTANIVYQNEIKFLHYALVHAGYTVDFVDDYDIASGTLQQRGYTTLYLTGPNVANDKNMIPQPPNSTSNPPPIPSPQDQIQSWVKQGGVLAVTPGGGVADEYNSQQSIFDEILGLSSNSRKDIRYLVGSTSNDPNHDFDMTDTMTITDPRFGSPNEKMYISNPLGKLTRNTTDPNPPTTAASFSNGDPAITVHNYGTGIGIAYAFFPGFHYQQTANWDNTLSEPSQGAVLPYGWGKIQRDIVTAPAAKFANTPRPVTLTQNGKILEMVEACLLESDKGIAIVLLNWSDTPEHTAINNLKITINNSPDSGIQGNPDPPIIPIGSKISSAQAQDSGSGVVVTPTSTTSPRPPFNINLSKLDYVDIIMIDAEISTT